MVMFKERQDPAADAAIRHALAPTRGKAGKVVSSSRVGQVVTISFNRQQTDYRVIAQYKNRKAVTVYLLSEWNTTSGKLMQIYSDGYQITEGKATFHQAGRWLDERDQAMRNAWRLIGLLRRIRLALREVSVGAVNMAELGDFTGYRGRYEIEAKTGYFSYDGDGEIYFGSQDDAMRLIFLEMRTCKRLNAEMQKAGIG